jgi:hypothetical protein
MGRRRKRDTHLPERVYFKHGAHYYVNPATGKWENLGKTLADMYRAYAKIVDVSANTRTMNDVFDRYSREELPKLAERAQRDYAGYLINSAPSSARHRRAQ